MTVPLEYTLLELAVAVEGVAMLRHWPGNGTEVKARLTEVRRLLDGRHDETVQARVPVHVYNVAGGCERWAPSYDGPNPAIDLEQRVVHDMLHGVPVGRALVVRR